MFGPIKHTARIPRGPSREPPKNLPGNIVQQPKTCEHSNEICSLTKVLLFVLRYTSGNIDELSLHPGDIIQPMGQLEPGWWAGRVVLSSNTKKGIIGVFPSNYVKCFSLEL